MKSLIAITLLLTLAWCAIQADESNHSEVMQLGCNTSVLLFDDFETDPTQSGWSGSGFGWCHESSMAGPDSACSGECCVGTNCSGNFGAYTTYEFISPPTPLPSLPPGGFYILQFKEWYSVPQCNYDPQSCALVEISADNGPWDTIIEPFYGTATGWSIGGVELSQYAGSNVRIRFTFRGGYPGYLNNCLGPGWYIDDVGIYLKSFGVQAGTNQVICKGDSIELMAFTGCGIWPYNYSWTPSDGLDDPYIQNPMASPDSTTTYTVTVTDDSSQVATDKVVVSVLSSPSKPSLIGPYPCDHIPFPVYFEWESVSGAIEYHLQVDDISNFVSPDIDIFTDVPNYLDTANILEGQNQFYWRVCATDGGCWGQWSDVWILLDADQNEASGIPKDFELRQNRPNPFNPITQIEFALPRSGHVSLYVYDILGRKVRTLVSGKLDAGIHTVMWDGMDSSGRPVASGIYFYQLKAVDFLDVKKMVIVK